MGRIPRGAPAKGCPSKGSWGDRYLIENTYQSKRVSCATCEYYCAEDKSCSVKPLYVPSNGYNYWIKCDFFVLAQEYRGDIYYEEIVERYKGGSLNISVNPNKVADKSKKNSECEPEKIDFKKQYRMASGCPYFNKYDNHCKHKKGNPYCRVLRNKECGFARYKG